MRNTDLYEGVEYGDLETLVLGRVSIGEFKPKIGEIAEVTVIGFFVIDEMPADDLARFLEAGTEDILDTEVSPNPDEDGNYMVFVEVPNNEKLMENTFKLIIDTNRLCLNDLWTLEFYESEPREISIDEIEMWVRDNRIA